MRERQRNDATTHDARTHACTHVSTSDAEKSRLLEESSQSAKLSRVTLRKFVTVHAHDNAYVAVTFGWIWWPRKRKDFSWVICSLDFRKDDSLTLFTVSQLSSPPLLPPPPFIASRSLRAFLRMISEIDTRNPGARFSLCMLCTREDEPCACCCTNVTNKYRLRCYKDRLKVKWNLTDSLFFLA